MSGWSFIILFIIAIFSISMACEKSAEKIQGNKPALKESIDTTLNEKSKQIIITVHKNGNYKVKDVPVSPTHLKDVLKRKSKKMI